jgi:hypothetical protein
MGWLVLDNLASEKTCLCPDCAENASAGHGDDDNSAHGFCYACTFVGCTSARARCSEEAMVRFDHQSWYGLGSLARLPHEPGFDPSNIDPPFDAFTWWLFENRRRVEGRS